MDKEQQKCNNDYDYRMLRTEQTKVLSSQWLSPFLTDFSDSRSRVFVGLTNGHKKRKSVGRSERNIMGHNGSTGQNGVTVDQSSAVWSNKSQVGVPMTNHRQQQMAVWKDRCSFEVIAEITDWRSEIGGGESKKSPSVVFFFIVHTRGIAEGYDYVWIRARLEKGKSGRVPEITFLRLNLKLTKKIKGFS